MRRNSLLALVLCSLGCDDSARKATRAVVAEAFVRSDSGAPIPGVAVLVDGEVEGQTDRGGQLRLTLAGRSGRAFRIEPSCPDGYERPSRAETVRLRSYDGTDPAVEVHLECRPQYRLAAVIVRAINAPGIRVLLDGELVARTNEEGVAQFHRLAPSGTEFLVELDASELPAMLPRRVARKLSLPDADELFLIEQTFRSRKAPKTRPARRRILRIE